MKQHRTATKIAQLIEQSATPQILVSLTTEQLQGRLDRLKAELQAAADESPQRPQIIAGLQSDLMATHVEIASPRRAAKRARQAPDWATQRAVPTDSDRVMLSATHVWLRLIPTSRQPKQLCRHFPRVANALALCWDDAALADRMLVDLMVDRRGGRAGFPQRVIDELQVLRNLRERMGSRSRTTERILRNLTAVLGRKTKT